MSETSESHPPSIHKSDSRTSEEVPLHVHFSEEQLLCHDAHIVVRETSETQRDIHLGFMQYRHQYDIKLQLSNNLGPAISSDPLQNLFVKFKEAVPTAQGDGHVMIFSFFAHREKLLKEIVVLKSASDPKKKLLIVFHARVLGKGQGTPALRDGIHCTKVEWDEESEGSDWQGF